MRILIEIDVLNDHGKPLEQLEIDDIKDSVEDILLFDLGLMREQDTQVRIHVFETE